MKEEYIYSLIKIANNDLACAKILYRKKFYPQSLFLLQQAIEKSYKAIGLITNKIDIPESKNVSHDYMKLLRKVLLNYQDVEKERIISLSLKALGKNYSDNPKNIIKEIENTSNKEFFNLSESEIEEFFALLKKYKRKMNPLKFTKVKNLKEDYELALLNKYNSPAEVAEINKIIASTNDGLNKEESIFMVNFQKHSFALHIVGLITSPNFEQSRYPILKIDNTGINCPIEIYTDETPIIKKQKEIMQITEKAIKFLINM